MTSNWIFDWIAPVYDTFTWHHSFEVMAEALGTNNSDTLLDLGGGTGAVTKRMADEISPRRAILFDLSQSMLAQAEELSPVRVRGNGEFLPFADDSVDRFLMSDSLHHMDSIEHVLAEMGRVASGDAILVVEEFNPETFLGRFIEMMERGLGTGQEFWSPDDLKLAMREFGFRCTALREEGFVYYATFEITS